MEEKEIIRRCQDGEAEVYRIIYEKYGQFMYNSARRMLGNAFEAEDAVQSAFMRLFRGMKHFRSQSKLSTYLYRILMNVCFDMLQKRKRERFVDLEEDMRTHRPDHELRFVLEESIASLPQMQRACFILFAVEGMKQTDIAEIMDISLNGVKSNVYHAKNRLRKLLRSS